MRHENRFECMSWIQNQRQDRKSTDINLTYWNSNPWYLIWPSLFFIIQRKIQISNLPPLPRYFGICMCWKKFVYLTSGISSQHASSRDYWWKCEPDQKLGTIPNRLSRKNVFFWKIKMSISRSNHEKKHEMNIAMVLRMLQNYLWYF